MIPIIKSGPRSALLRQIISDRAHVYGSILNLLSAGAFYFATFFLRLETTHGGVSAETFAIYRYALGFILYGLILAVFRISPFQGSFRFLFMRSVFNVTAVLCFYRAVELGEAGKANVLNMTYPAFIALFAGPLIGEIPDRKTVFLTVFSVIGIIMQFQPPFLATQMPSYLWGLFSGLLAAIAVISLRGAARSAPAPTVLFWMFAFGLPILIPLGWNDLMTSGLKTSPYLWISAVFGVAGQWLLTESYRTLSAAAGSIISTMRIPIALIMGFLILDEKFSWIGWTGAILIFICNLLLAFPKNMEKVEQE